MHKIIQLVGIPASGKSYLLNKCQENGILRDINYIEFGKEIKYLLSKKNINTTDKNTTKESVKEVLDDIIENKQPAIFTSHIIFYNGDAFSYNSELEFYANSIGYIYVFSEASTILKRRIKDNQQGIKNREISNLEFITNHRDLSLKTTLEVANLIGSKFLKIYNEEGFEEYNIKNIANFITEILGYETRR